MEGGIERFMGSELLAELRSWNQQEQEIRVAFSDQALQDKTFLKIKLKEYDRIWHKHRGGEHTLDEKTIMLMLQYHRRKIQKAIYPGLLTRMVVQTFNFLTAKIKQRKVIKKPEPYNSPPIVVPKEQVQNQGQEKSRQAYQRKEHSQQINRQQRRNRSRNKKKGRSI